VVKAVIILIVFIILYMPIVVIGLQSINDSKTLYNFGGWTLKWYGALFNKNNPEYDRALMPIISNTLVVTFIATTVSTVLGTFIAIGINSLKAKDRQKVIMLNNIPILNADIVTGMSLMLIFSALLPVFPNLFGFKTVLLAHIFFTLPYVVLSVLPKLREIDPNLYDAAVDLGCTPFRALLKVVIPSIKAGILAGMLLAFTMSIDDFVISYFTAGNFNNISIWIYATVGKRSLSPAVYAYNTLITLATLAILLLINIQSYFKAKKIRIFNLRRV
jgi:spermidine/putrescine transport system permease protein